MSIKTGPLKQTEADQRESFRIDDTLAVIICKIEDKEFPLTGEPFRDDLQDLSLVALQKENINPYLWKMLVNLNKKLDHVLERLPVDLIKTKAQPINLSSTGMKVKVNKNFEPEETVRIKMLLPTLPAKEMVITGKVVRVEASEDGEYEVALHFLDLDEEVRDELFHYTLNRQRKAITAQRQQRSNDESIEQKNI
jgi:hypothetical protein